MTDSSDVSITPFHRRRLREVYRSAGWPCLDSVEIELLAAGLLERRSSALGHVTVHVTDPGIALIADTLQRNRARRDPHEELVGQVAVEMTRAGRLAWRGLSLRAKVGEAWQMAMPDVFSIRQSTVEAYLEPLVHEIKVNRSDLLADLRRPAKRAAYLDVGSACWYVIRAGIAEPNEIPLECGVIIATRVATRAPARTGTPRDPQAGEDDGKPLFTLDVARPAPTRPARMSLGLWMALAKATPLRNTWADGTQASLGDPLAASVEAEGSSSNVSGNA